MGLTRSAARVSGEKSKRAGEETEMVDNGGEGSNDHDSGY